MNSLENYEELSTFSNIRYTPAWYYKQYPGFYNIECYKILSANTRIVPIPEQMEEDMEAPIPITLTQENKKRGYEEVEHSKDLDHGVCCGL